MLELYIGNKNYSSWSMRPWLILKHAGIRFQEHCLALDFKPGSPFKQNVARFSPAGRVPVLVDEGWAIWDSLAIAEYLAERFPGQSLWPDGARERARARSLCAEMHAGFTVLRTLLPMNIELSLPDVGPRLMAKHADLVADVQRINALLSELLQTHQGPWLFGRWSIADAYFAPVCARLRGYGIPISAPVADYITRLWAEPSVQTWVQEACAEHAFLPAAEPYRDAPAW